MSILRRVAFILCLSLLGHAQEVPAPTPEEAPSAEVTDENTGPTTPQAGLWKKTLGSSKESRAEKRYGVLGNFSLFEMWVLTKYGFTLEYIANPSWTWEFEYMHGSLSFGYFGLNIGRIQESRASILARSFGHRNSLNFLMGVFYDTFDLHLGSSLLDSVPGVPSSQIDLVRTHAMGLTWGIGNRWQTSQGFILGIDWLVINLPLTHFGQKSAFLDASNDTHYEDQVRNALNLLNKIPSAGILKFQVGMIF